MSAQTVTVGLVSAMILDRDDSRQSLLLQNLSQNDIWIGIGEEAQAGKGMWMKAGQAAEIYLSKTSLGDIVCSPIYAIASADDSALFVIDHTWA